MSQKSSSLRFLRSIGIILMGLTAGLTLLGGIGLACVAFKPTGFGATMAKLAPMQWLYIVFFVVGIALGVLGIRATIALVKGAQNAYSQALIVLLGGIVLGVIHIIVSRSLRGNSMPVDPIVYVTALTLVIFLLFRIPAIWQAVDFSKGNTKSNLPAGGAAAIVMGLLALTIQYTMGPSHTWDNVNYANAFNLSMTIVGVLFLLTGVALLVSARLPEKTAEDSLLETKTV